MKGKLGRRDLEGLLPPSPTVVYGFGLIPLSILYERSYLCSCPLPSVYSCRTITPDCYLSPISSKLYHTDCASHIAKAIPNPRINVLKAIAAQVITGVTTGALDLIPLFYSISNIDAVLNTTYPSLSPPI